MTPNSQPALHARGVGALQTPTPATRGPLAAALLTDVLIVLALAFAALWAAGLAPFALAVWVPPTWQHLAGLGVVAAFATLGHYTMARAFAAAPLTVTQPVTFLQLVWASLLGWIAFGEAVDPFVLLGGGMIIAAISYMTWREARARRREITPAPEAAKL